MAEWFIVVCISTYATPRTQAVRNAKLVIGGILIHRMTKKKIKAIFSGETRMIIVLSVAAVLIGASVAAGVTFYDNQLVTQKQTPVASDISTQVESIDEFSTNKAQEVDNSTTGNRESGRAESNTNGGVNNYISGSCYVSESPYKTIYANDSSLEIGKTRVINGINGLSLICSDNSDGTNDSRVEMAPTDEIIYSGTKPINGPLPTEPSMTRTQCVNGYIETYGWGSNSSARLLEANQWCAANGY